MKELEKIYNKARKKFIEYYKTCPLCKGPTNHCRMIENNRECIACNNPEGFGYSYKPKTTSELNVLKSSWFKLELADYIERASKDENNI